VLMVKVGNVQKRRNIGHLADEPAPPGLDYDTWTGPVPQLPFNRNRFHGTVNWHWHYGCGDIGNDGVHFIDIARWVLDVDYPAEVTGMGRKLYFDDDQQTPDTMNVTFNYPNKVLHFEQRLWNGYRMDGTENSVIAYGTDGMAILGRWQGGHYEFRVFDSAGRQVSSDREERPDFNNHARNFIDCVKSRKLPNADIEIGAISTNLCHLGNIVARTGQPVRFEPKTEAVAGAPDASQYVSREYRRHWSTPRGA
ncbi:MAG: Gfo/Idh/MocA family protein, partial [Bryobacteraceae bacterium]